MAVIDMSAITQLKTQISEMMQVYNALSHPTGIANLATGLNGSALRNVLPGTQELQGDVSGLTSGGSLASQAQQFLNQNQLYKPQGNDFQAQQMNQAAQSSANIEALASNANSALQQRMTELDQIKSDCVDTGTDVTQLQACNARLQAEQNFVAAQQAQLASLQLMADQQTKVQQQQDEQNRRKSVDQYLQDTQPNGAAPATGGASQCSFCG